jgi:signal transduction histidine kinase
VTALSFSDLEHLGAYLVPALVWTIIAVELWRYLLTRPPVTRDASAMRSPAKPLLVAVATCMALHQLVSLPFPVVPHDVLRAHPGWAGLWQGIADATVVAAVVAFRHLTQHMSRECARIGRAWVAVNYGSGVAAVAVAESAHALAIPQGAITAVMSGFVAVMMGLALRDVSRATDGGWWRPASAAGAGRPDVIVVVVGLAAAMFWLVICVLATPQGWPGIVLDTLVPLVLAIPFAVRMLGTVVRLFLQVTAMLLAAAGVFVGGRVLEARLEKPWLVTLVQLATVFALLVLLGPGQAWLRAVLERALFGRSRSRHQELHEFLHALSPAAGIGVCCRRAAEKIVAVMQLRGAGILVDGPGGDVEVGAISLAALRPRWPSGTAAVALPSTPYGGEQIGALPADLAGALVEAKVVCVIPVVSPRKRWGALFLAAGPLGASFSTEDLQALESLACQLALVLDAAELLERTVTAERMVAHTEKLAAIGELAARVAHEIRNPITAARSLAQQLAREPGATNPEEHEIILTELSRVERQVATLLRFARRDEFRFEPVDLGVLAGRTVAELRARLDTAAIAVDLACEEGLVLPADGEKLRQVLVNLVENAIDALGTVPVERRRLSVTAARRNGAATIRVRDAGPGVGPEALPNLFEPFFSGKPSGTGLGLAIAKRTVDAHGGRITAASRPGEGLTIDIELPLHRPA